MAGTLLCWISQLNSLKQSDGTVMHIARFLKKGKSHAKT